MAKKTLNRPGSGRLPSLENLGDKSPSQLVRTLARFGLEPDMREFKRRARRVYEEQLEKAIEEKGEPDASTWAAIDGQLERAMTQTLRRQTKAAITQYRIGRLDGVAKHFVWIAVGRGSCPSCEDRHGKRKSMREWERYGLPGSGVLACQSECRCSLQPELISDE
jgi:hypothetical protein